MLAFSHDTRRNNDSSGCHPYAMGLGRICFTPRDLFPPLVVRRVATLAFAPPGGVALFNERADIEGR